MPFEFKHLFTPLQVGPVTVPNRCLVTAHTTFFVKDDPEGYHEWSILSDRAAYYHAERAKGGFGLLIIGQTEVHPSCGVIRPAGYLERVIPAYRKIADGVHQHGGKIFVQINHNGWNRTSGTDDWAPVWAVSSVPLGARGAGEMCKEIEKDDIKEVVRGFALTARNMKAAGMDGVEIHAAHGYLLAEFLNPATNRRTDEYGGEMENRIRFLMEVVDAVRAEVGRDFAVGVRVNGEWRMQGGQTVNHAIEIALRLEDTRKIDFIDVSGWPVDLCIAPTGSPYGHLIHLARAVKKAASSLPVFAAGRIVDPTQAEQIVARGDADMIAMTRGSIADPELPRKAREGRLGEIRACVGGGQGCLGRISLNLPATCSQNPAVGREKEWGVGTVTPAPRKKSVLVVGGGPAGMEAAMVAAQRGHGVVLCDQSDSLGGQVKLIIRSPRRDEFRNIIDFHRRMLEDLGVQLRLNTDVTPGLVDSMGPDAVILATGSRPRMDGWYPPRSSEARLSGSDLPHVFSPWDVLNGRLDRGHKHVAIVDELGYYQSSDPLEYLLARGIQVSGITTASTFAAAMVSVDRQAAATAWRGKGVAFYNQCVVTAIRPDAVDVYQYEVGQKLTVGQVDAVVLSVGSVAVDGLYGALKGGSRPIYRVGDCLAPRRIEHATFEGHKAGREV